MFRELNLKDDTVNFFLNVLDIAKYFNIKNNDTHCTINGFQSLNMRRFFPDIFIDNFLPSDIKAKQLKHIHLIEYFKEGYQLEHDHTETGEAYSFIIYLNDSDGDTVLYLDENKKNVKPVKNKMIIFESRIRHEALVSNKNKKIAVGAIYND
tara:strand:- start:3101 stop:3556 length:456 start_codon:yes stop_codon:yes gene_type:complete